ncbi:MAG: hypothetical protein QOF60_1936 [Actinomycetota bacterium]|jgi:RNA polymerase sigma factor (sigma-70 family)|nr:hypothetical protein [Actinomycetota bacterium]
MAATACDVDAALTAAYRSYAKRVRRMAIRRLGDRDAADDVVQDTFEWLQSHVDQFAGARNPEAYVVRIAANHCNAALRRLQRASYAAPVDPLRMEEQVASEWSTVATMDEPGAAEDQAVDAAAVLDALASIDPAHRDLLRLRADGMPYDAIAQRNDTTPGAARAMMLRARDSAATAYRTVTSERGLLGGVAIGWRRLQARARRLVPTATPAEVATYAEIGGRCAAVTAALALALVVPTANRPHRQSDGPPPSWVTRTAMGTLEPERPGSLSETSHPPHSRGPASVRRSTIDAMWVDGSAGGTARGTVATDRDGVTSSSAVTVPETAGEAHEELVALDCTEEAETVAVCHAVQTLVAAAIPSGSL